MPLKLDKIKLFKRSIVQITFFIEYLLWEIWLLIICNYGSVACNSRFNWKQFSLVELTLYFTKEIIHKVFLPLKRWRIYLIWRLLCLPYLKWAWIVVPIVYYLCFFEILFWKWIVNNNLVAAWICKSREHIYFVILVVTSLNKIIFLWFNTILSWLLLALISI